MNNVIIFGTSKYTDLVEHYFETYLVESSEGPPRKYYRITSLGKERGRLLLKEWNAFHETVNNFIKESETYDER